MKPFRLLCMLIPAGFFIVTACTATSGHGPDRSMTNKPAFDEARHLLDQGRAVEAVSAFRALLREDSSDLRGLNGLGIAYSELGRTDLSAEMFARALALSPDDPATLNNIGFSALRRAEPVVARHYLEKAKKRQSAHQEIDGNLIRLATLEASLTNEKTNVLTQERTTPPITGRSSRPLIVNVPSQPEETVSRHVQAKERLPETTASSMIDVTSFHNPFAAELIGE
jgi:Flp pilus assembly protein TadD